MSTDSAELGEAFLEFYKTYYRDEIGELAQGYPKDSRSLYVDWTDLHTFDNDLADDYINQPEQLREYAEEALRMYDLPVDISLANAHVRVYNLPASQTFYPGEYSPSAQDGRLLTIEGQVERVSDVKAKPEVVAWECQRCGTITRIPQSDVGGMDSPIECQGCERQGPFQLDNTKTETVDRQLIRVTTPPEIAAGDLYEDIEVVDDAVDQVEAGDRVALTGQFRLIPPSDDSNFLFDDGVDGHSVAVKESDVTDIDLDDDMADRVRAYASGEHGDPYELWTQRISPSIQDRETIHLAIALQQFEGVRTVPPDGDPVRGSIHILEIGDPGTGKSSDQQSVANLAPLSVQASGKGASVAGMTAAVTSGDDFADGRRSLEAGAMVLANNGVALLDELDKMKTDVEEALHTAMEKQQVSINKWGINATLPSQASVLAAANPKYSRWDTYEPLWEQITIGETLLSRFDLIFPLYDKPDEDLDSQKADAVVDHKRQAKQVEQGALDEDEMEYASPIPTEVARAWVALARRDFHPVETDEAAAKMKESWTTLRAVNGYGEDAAVPIGVRDLSSIQRLAEASAKLRLSHYVEVEDVERAHSLLGEMLANLGFDDDADQFDIDIKETGTPRSQHERVKALQEAAEDLDSDYDEGVPKEVLVEELVEEYGIKESNARKEIKREYNAGALYSPQNDECYRWIGR